MLSGEPHPTAVLLAVSGALILVSVLFSRASDRFGVPVALGFLAIGIAAGPEGLLGISFQDYGFAYRLGTAALALILFDGGLNTSVKSLKAYAAPAAVLATVGVAGTAALVALGGRLFGLDWTQALLLGAVVSSTDAAAVFGVLRSSRIQLKHRTEATLELESGLNDPMAVLLTVALTRSLTGAESVGWGLALEIACQFGGGALLGAAIGLGGRQVLRRVALPAGGLYPVLTLGLALAAYGLPTLLGASGFLSVYVAGVALGAGPLPYKSGLARVHDSLAWLSQVAMFLVLGLLAAPSRLGGVAWVGLGLAIALAFVARPLVVVPCLLAFHFPIRDAVYVGWVGLRGAVPVVLATFPVLSGAPGAQRIFDIVFFVVVLGALLPGATVRWVTRQLGQEGAQPPPPVAVLEIASRRMLKGDLMSFYIDAASAACNSAIADLPFPEGASVALVLRGDELVAPRGKTVLTAGDHVSVFCRPEDRSFIHLVFGREED